MGMSIGSSVSGGVEDVLYARNVMNETSGQWGMGVHIKTRTDYGGDIRNIVYEDNTFYTAGVPGGAMHVECGYQSGQHTCACVASLPLLRCSCCRFALVYLPVPRARRASSMPQPRLSLLPAHDALVYASSRSRSFAPL